MRLDAAVEGFVSGYFSTCRRSPKTVRAYATDLGQFAMAIGSCASLDSVSAECLEAWATKLQDLGYATSSIRRKFAVVGVFFRYWVRRGVVDRSPLRQVRLDLAPQRLLPRVLELRDVTQLLMTARASVLEASSLRKRVLASRNQAILEVLFATGLRIGEVVALDAADVRDGELRVMGKGGRERFAHLPDRGSRRALAGYERLREILEPESKALFLNARGARLSTQGAANALRGIAQSAGICEAFTPHMLRHTIATQLLENGADVRMVQEFLGHASITTTQRYTHVTRRHVRSMVAAHHPSLTRLSRQDPLTI